jgi:hypothetical protein
MSGKKSAVLLVVGLLGSALAGCKAPANQTPPTAATQPTALGPVSIDSLPKAVVDAVQTDMPGATLVKAKVTSAGNYYLSDVKYGKKEYNLTVSPDGKIVNKAEDDD